MSDELKTRLLVVDDEQSIRRLCMTIGNSLNFACAEAESAEAALARLDAEIPDLVLTDLKLPTQSGVELLRQINRFTAGDYPVMLAYTLAGAVLVVVGNLVADIALTIADPRIRLA